MKNTRQEKEIEDLRKANTELEKKDTFPQVLYWKRKIYHVWRRRINLIIMCAQ